MLATGTKILTINGWKSIESLNIGDQLITPTNKINTITKIIPSNELRQVATCNTIDGATICTDVNYQWDISYKFRDKYPPNKIINTTDLSTILDSNKNQKRNHVFTKSVNAIEFQNNNEELLIDPYIIGCIIGGIINGNNNVKSLNIITDDSFIIDTIKELLPSDITLHRENRSDIYYFQGRTDLLSLFVHEYHIDSLYKTASIEERMSLFRGVCDVGGLIRLTKDGIILIRSYNKQIILDLQEIAWSLGYFALIKKYRSKTHNLPDYELNIEGDHIDKLVLSYRKKSQIKRNYSTWPATDTKYMRRIDKIIIEPEYKTTYTITTNGTERLFVAGDYFVIDEQISR